MNKKANKRHWKLRKCEKGSITFEAREERREKRKQKRSEFRIGDK